MIGPVWLTSQSILKEHEMNIDLTDQNKFKTFGLSVPSNKLNFGWLMMESEGTETLSGSFEHISNDIKNRLFLVSDKVFTQIINDSLEVRTSVAIDPATGAAEEGALYTYEAIPRATVMWFDVVFNRPEYFMINGNKPIVLGKPINYQDPLRRSMKEEDQIGFMAFNVEKGLQYLETLGVGGMNTRGMGRLQVLNIGG